MFSYRNKSIYLIPTHIKTYVLCIQAGAGGSCQAMKFWPWDTDRVVSALLDGTVTLHDFEGRQNQILADTKDSYE